MTTQKRPRRVDLGFAGQPMWTVECREALTLTPSLLCSCGDHGLIRNG